MRENLKKALAAMQCALEDKSWSTTLNTLETLCNLLDLESKEIDDAEVLDFNKKHQDFLWLLYNTIGD